MSDNHSTDAQADPSVANDAPGNSSASDTTVGGLLRGHRERAGLSIADVSRVLRISQKYLEALEDGRNADLPGLPYAIGFVRSYADHLHLDSGEIVRRYKDEAEGLSGKSDLVFPKPIPDGGVPGAAVLGLGVIVAAVAYGVWYWQTNKDEVDIARVEAVPEHLAAKIEDAQTETPKASEPEAVQTAELAAESVAESVTPAQEQPEAAAEQVAERADATTNAVADEVTQAVGTAEDGASSVEEAVAAEETPEPAPAIETAEQEAAATPDVATEAAEQVVQEGAPVEGAQTQAPSAENVEEVAETPATGTTEVAAVPEPSAEPEPAAESVVPAARDNDGPSRITVRAVSNSWIQVRDEVADRLLFTRLLRAGDTYDVPNRSGLRLMTGNAGALELLVDGKTVPSIGGVGEVRRNVDLDAEKLKNGAAVAQ